MENQAFERLLHDCLYTENNGWNQTKISFYYRIPAPWYEILNIIFGTYPQYLIYIVDMSCFWQAMDQHI